MTKSELQTILEKHQLWLDGEPGGEKANLAGADLEGAFLFEVNLSFANLTGANLAGANLEGASFYEAGLRGANLAGANLRGTNLEGANFFKANLKSAILYKANLSYASLREANLERANFLQSELRYANLTGATLTGANFENANIYKTKGLLSAIDYLSQNFEKTENGYIVYKSFGMYYGTRTDWTIEKDGIIEDVVDFDRRNTCGYGINVATKDWIKREDPKVNKVWKCLIKWEWLPGVVVPYATDGNIRSERLMLLEKVDI